MNDVTLVPPRDIEVANIRKEMLIDASDVKRIKDHKEVIKKFVSEVLAPEVDYTTLDGKVEKFLTKAGAEKLKMLFGLGVRFKEEDKMVDKDDNFLLFSHEAEVYHLKTGIALATCIGACNSHEKKYKQRAVYEKGVFICREPTPIYDIYNTILKMSQKRAMVGAVILAVNASDYLTQDDDEVTEQGPQQRTKPRDNGSKFTKSPTKNHGNFVVTFGAFKNQKLKDIPRKRLESYINQAKSGDTEPTGPLKELIDVVREYLREEGQA